MGVGMKDKFQILRDFANSNDKPDKTIYQFIKEILDMDSAYAKENKQLKNNWNKLKKGLEEETRQYWNTDLLNKMIELEQGSDSNE